MFMQSQAFFGADSTIHAELMRHLDRSQVEVHVACTSERHENATTSALRRIAAIPDVRLRPTNFGPTLHGVSSAAATRRLVQAPALALSLLQLAAYIRVHHIAVIHATEKPRDALYAVVLGKLTGARTVIHMHVAFEGWLSRWVNWALRRADGIIAISDFVADSLVAAGYPRERVTVVPNSLDLGGWDPTIDGADVRRELGLAPTAPVVGIASRLFKWKGHGFLLEAIARINTRLPGARLVIVGEDDPRADPYGGSYRSALQAQARELHVEENVLFTGFRTDIPRLMAAFDVFAHPSWEEPFGMVFLEAMAMRKPVVAWASGGAPEVILNGQTGLLAERGSVDSLAEALLTLLTDEPLRRRLGEAGRRRVETVFTPANMCRDTLNAYRTVLQRPNHRPLASPSSLAGA
jgi:glycosyltransferase involved in cell wall biosynthesis